MKRNFTSSIYFLLFLLIGTSYEVFAHKAIDKPTNELPNFVSPHLFNNLNNRLKTPLRTDENIITWSNAIAKGLAILKVGNVGMSYNDFIKKGGADSVKIEEGGVDCIKYRISRTKDSIAIGEEFELTITAEYIDNIPYTWQNKDCGDFCIKVFLPEGFIQTGGDYRDFEGFSLRPDGLKRIERKIIGYFESKSQNNCFLLTKGAKYYDPQYLLEVKQNYCYKLFNQNIKSVTTNKSIVSLNSSYLKNEVEKFSRENIDNNFIVSTAGDEVCGGDGFKKTGEQNEINTQNPIYFCIKTTDISCTGDYSFQARVVFSNQSSNNFLNNSLVHLTWHSNGGCCNDIDDRCNNSRNNFANNNLQFTATKVAGSNYFEANGVIPNTNFVGAKHFDILCNDNLVSCHCAWGQTTGFSMASPIFTPNSCTGIITAQCAVGVPVWTNINGQTNSITVSNSGTYGAKCKKFCNNVATYESLEGNVTIILNPVIPTNIELSYVTNIDCIRIEKYLTSSCTNGTIRWFKDDAGVPFSTSTTVLVDESTTYRVDCGCSGNGVSKFGYYDIDSKFVGDLEQPTCFGNIKGKVKNLINSSEPPNLLLKITNNGVLKFSKAFIPAVCTNDNTSFCFEILKSEFSNNISTLSGNIDVSIEATFAPTCRPIILDSKSMCCDIGSEITINSNSNCSTPREVGATVNIYLSDIDNTYNVTWTGPNNFTQSGGSTVSISNAQSINNGTYYASITKNGSVCNLTRSICVQVITNQCITDANVAFKLQGSTGNSYLANDGEGLNFELDKSNVPASYTITWYKKTGGGAWDNITALITDNLTKFGVIYSASNSSQYYKVEITKSGCTTITKQIEVQYKNCGVIAEFWVNTTNYKGSSGTAYVGSTINFSATSLPNANYVWTGPNFGPLYQREGSISNITAANGGIYTVTVSNVAGCGNITATMVVDVICFPLDITTSVVENDIFVGNTGIMSVGVGSKVVLSVTAPTGATFGWSGPSAAINGGNYNTQTINIPYMTQAMSGGYTVVVSKDGCTANKSFSVHATCSALNNVNAYSNSPNYEVKTGEKLNLWVDKGGPNYTHTFYGPTHNFTWVGQFAGVENVDDSYSGIYNVVIGYAGCTQTITRQVSVNIFKCNIGVDTTNVVCNPATGTINSFKVIAQNYTDPRTVSFKLEVLQTDSQGNPYFTNVVSYPSWVQAIPNVIPKQYIFSNLPSGTYRIWTKEQNLSENGGAGRVCESSAKTFTIKCDPCSYVKIDASPTDRIIPAPNIAAITLTANYYNTPPSPINVNSLSSFSWTGPNGFSKTTQSVSPKVPGNYIVNYTAAYNNSYTKTCTASKLIPMDNCAVPISVVSYKTSCEGGVQYAELKVEGDFSNMEFSSNMEAWSSIPKVPLTGSLNAGYKIFGRSLNFQTCIFELITITKTCDCTTEGVMTINPPKMDCALGSSALAVDATFNPDVSKEFKIKKKDGTFETAWATTTIYNNLSAGSYIVYARKQGSATCYIQSTVDVSTKLPESPVSYPCDINKNVSIGETATSINIKTQKFWAGNALLLDGVKDFAETPTLSEFSGSAFTFETWALPDPNASIKLFSEAEVTNGVLNPTGQRYLAQGKANSSRVFVSISLGDNGLNIIEETATTNSKKVIYSVPININKWIHVAVTYQSSSYKVFVNGALYKTITSTNSVNGIDPPKLIGGSTDGFFKGKVDETRWWNSARTEADIKAKMSVALVSPYSTELKRYYRYDQVNGMTIPNVIAAGTNDITIGSGECNAFVDNTSAQTGLELYPLFTWSNGATGRELTITTPATTTCYTVVATSPLGASCYTQICIPIENCTDINVTVTPSATVQENAGVRPLLSADIPNTNVWPTVNIDFETSLQMTGNNIINVGDYRWLDNTFTYEFWAKPTLGITTELDNFGDPNGSTNRHLLRIGSTSDQSKTGFGLTLGSNGLVLFENGPNFMSLKTKYYSNFANKWTHIAVVYDDGKPRIYVNGELVYSSNVQSSRRVIGGTEIGWINNTGFDGLIDEFRIWSSARTAQEIKDNFDKTVLATTPNIGYWRFNRSNVGKVIDTPTKIYKDESIYERQMTMGYYSANVTNTPVSELVKVNPKITWWLEKKNPTTGEITEEQVGVGNQYKIPLDLIKQGTYNYIVKFVKNDNTICKRIKTITVTPNTEPVTCFEIQSDGNYNLISGNVGTNLKQTLSGVTLDRIWKRTYRASDNSYFVYSAFNGLAWQKNGAGGADPITLVDGDPNNATHRWRFEDIGNNRFHVRSLESNNRVLCTQNPNCGDQCTIIGGYADWAFSQRNFKVQEVTCPVIDEVENCVADGRISYQRWDNVSGGTIANLNAVINNTPSNEDYITSLEKQGWGADNYGTRIRGYICPPTTGYYTFWVAGDDNVELWLSTDDKVGGKKRIAYHNEWSGTREYTKFYTQESPPIPLKKGKKYYIEVLHKEGGGGDGVSVRWRTPLNEMMEPIPGQYLAPYQACAAFTVKSTPEEEEILVDTKITMEVIKPTGVITDKIYTWTVFQGGANANLIDGNGNSVTTLDGYTAWAKPSDEGEMIYKVADKGDPSCYQFIKKKVKAVLCACKDCGDNGDAITTENPEVVANQFSATGQNYVVEEVYLTESASSNVAQTVSYFDGLGRPIQKINTKSGFAGGIVDTFVPIEYDAYGREANKHLLNSRPTQNGAIGAASSRGATAIVYENSPLSRVVSQTAPGSTIPVQFTYRTNTTGEIPYYKYQVVTGQGGTYGTWKKVVNVGSYTANKLYVTEVKDEKNNITTEYKDFEGRVICKKTTNLPTYYVYDDLGQLRCVIPPKAAVSNPTEVILFKESPTDTYSMDANNDDNIMLYFAYDFDARGRQVKKKVPDSKTELIVYDARDRVIRSKNSRGDWMYSDYDPNGLNRVVETGLCDAAGGSKVWKTQTKYDSYPANAIAFKAENQFPSSFNSSYLKGKVTTTTTKIEGVAGRTEVISTPYYDDYGRVFETASQSHVMNGLIYDLKKMDFVGRVLRSRQIVVNGTTTTVEQTFSYERSSKIKSVCQKVNTELWQPVGRYAYNGIGEMTQKTLGCKLQVLNYTYDLRSRMVRLNNPANLEASKSFFGMSLAYDEVGNINQQTYRFAQRKGKHTDPFAVQQNDLFIDEYSYDALNRLAGSKLSKGSAGNYIYKLENMSYDANGNINTLERWWQGQYKDRLVYGYYPNANRLQKVDDNGENMNQSGGEFFSENSTDAVDFTYDNAGNMITDANKDISLTYNYLNLVKTAKGNSYTYTATGQKTRMVSPAGIFDYIGSVVFRNSEVEFVATPEGRVLPPSGVKQNTAKFDPPYPTAPDTTNKYWRYEYDIKDHLGNLRVACRCAEQIETAQTKPEVGYAPTVVQMAHYDPWGIKLPLFLTNGKDRYQGSPEDRFKYNGKEQQPDIGYYDYGARMYDPTVGRWFGIDPLSELDFEESPYNYVDNNPINRIDLFGCTDVNNDGIDDGTLLDEVEVKAQRLPQYNDFWSNMTIAYNRNERLYGHVSPYREHFQAGGRDASAIIVGVPLAIAGAAAAIPYVGQGVAYLNRARMLRAGKFIASKSKSVIKDIVKVELNPGGGLADFANQIWQKDIGDINYASIASNTLFKNPFTAAFLGSYFDNTQKETNNDYLFDTIYGGVFNVLGNKLSTPAKGAKGEVFVGSFIGNMFSNFYGDVTKYLIQNSQNEKK